jgi:hypothetical protein
MAKRKLRQVEAYVSKDKKLSYSVDGLVLQRLGVDCETGDTCTPSQTQLFLKDLVTSLIGKGVFTDNEVAELLGLAHFEMKVNK